MDVQFLESFVATHGQAKAAELLGVTPSYVCVTLSRKRPVVVSHDGKRFRAYHIDVYGHRQNPTSHKRNAARRFAAQFMGAAA